jgi:hypothetical protein
VKRTAGAHQPCSTYDEAIRLQNGQFGDAGRSGEQLASDRAVVDGAVTRLERWLESMRLPGGYGGPVAHWWRDSLLYCGPGLDWRYEGIIHGYLTLFERTGERKFLEKARRAGDDLRGGQLPDYSFRSSCFEANPSPAGTPHEAAADIGLLLLARALRAQGEADWQSYLFAAEANILRFQFVHRWDPDARRLSDGATWFVPNKAATMIEALSLLAEITERDDYATQYVAPIADAILEHQVRDGQDRLNGAIAQASRSSTRIENYFPYYVARCIPGLCAAYRLLQDDRYLEGAMEAGRFLLRVREGDGGSPQVLYPGGRVNRFPRWIAGAGDFLRAFDELRPYGLTADQWPTIEWILQGQLPSGGIRPARGFRSQISQKEAVGPPDVRDLLPVVGWNDKAFRALAGRVDTLQPAPRLPPAELECSWRGRKGRYRETDDGFSFVADRLHYRWQKSQPWATWSGGKSTDVH